jgi:hypothetical protein
MDGLMEGRMDGWWRDKEFLWSWMNNQSKEFIDKSSVTYWWECVWNPKYQHHNHTSIINDAVNCNKTIWDTRQLAIKYKKIWLYFCFMIIPSKLISNNYLSYIIQTSSVKLKSRPNDQRIHQDVKSCCIAYMLLVSKPLGFCIDRAVSLSKQHSPFPPSRLISGCHVS